MRILDNGTDRKLDNVTLYLTASEAAELRESLLSLLDRPRANHHHIHSADYSKEITVCVYDERDLIAFNDRSKRLILKDE